MEQNVKEKDLNNEKLEEIINEISIKFSKLKNLLFDEYYKNIPLDSNDLRKEIIEMVETNKLILAGNHKLIKNIWIGINMRFWVNRTFQKYAIYHIEYFSEMFTEILEILAETEISSKDLLNEKETQVKEGVENIL